MITINIKKEESERGGKDEERGGEERRRGV